MTVSQSEVDAKELRKVLGSFVTGVTIITTCDSEGRPYGLTANSFSSVSLEPPLVLWSQALVSPSYPIFRDADRFAISILSEGQTDLSSRFAKSSTDKFAGVETIPGIGGIPLIKGASAFLECRKVTSYPGGDHAVFLGQVERMERSQRRPLVFGGGKYMVAFPHDLGAFSADLGVASIAHLEAVRMGTSAVAQLANELDTTTCLVVWGSHGPTVVRWEESARPVSSRLRTGVVLPILRSAAGQIFGAYLPRELTGPILARELEEASPPSPVYSYESGAEANAALDFGDYLPAELSELIVEINLRNASEETRRSRSITPGEAEARLAAVRQRRMAYNTDREAESGEAEGDKLAAVAAPVFDKDGFLVMAVVALGHDTDFVGELDSPAAAAVNRVAGELSARIGYKF